VIAERTASGSRQKGGTTPRPRLSIVIVVYRMPRQAMNTLYTLSPRHQREVAGSDYEVVVVENESDRTLDEDRVLSLGGNVRYYRRAEPGVSPTNAINFGLERCRAPYVGVMIDGARMVTPRVVRYALDAFAMHREALVVAPGYHVGRAEHEALGAGFDEAAEEALLDMVDWRGDGYQLFEVARFGAANPRGFFHPILETNGLFARRERFERIGGADNRFQLAGGGALNMHLYRSLGLLPGTRLVVLAGEGTFHQLHGGVSTSGSDHREELLSESARQIQEIWDGGFRTLEMEPVILGAVAGPALSFMAAAAARGQARFHRRAGKPDRPEWLDDPLRQGGR
jgi:hypothetical protein